MKNLPSQNLCQMGKYLFSMEKKEKLQKYILHLFFKSYLIFLRA